MFSWDPCTIHRGFEWPSGNLLEYPGGEIYEPLGLSDPLFCYRILRIEQN